MAFTITEAFVTQFRGNVTHLAQQKGSKLRNAVRREVVIGKEHAFERLAPSSAVKRASRHADTPLIDVVHSRRLATLSDYDWADLVDNMDKLKLLISPESEYTINGSNAVGRAIDSELLLSFDAAAKNGDGTTTAFDTTNQEINLGAADMTLASLIQAKKILDKGPFEEEDRFVAIGPDQLEALLANTSVTSVDFNTVKALVRGEIDTFMGFTFIKSTLLPKTGNIRSCYAWHKNAVGLAEGKDVTASIDKRADKNNSMQVYVCASIGGVRIDDKGLIRILCDESA